MDQIEDAAERVREFYRLVAELQGLLGSAEEGLNTQGMVGTEVEMIKQQLQEFKVGLASFVGCLHGGDVNGCECVHEVAAFQQITACVWMVEESD